MSRDVLHKRAAVITVSCCIATLSLMSSNLIWGIIYSGERAEGGFLGRSGSVQGAQNHSAPPPPEESGCFSPHNGALMRLFPHQRGLVSLRGFVPLPFCSFFIPFSGFGMSQRCQPTRRLSSSGLCLQKL